MILGFYEKNFNYNLFSLQIGKIISNKSAKHY